MLFRLPHPTPLIEGRLVARYDRFIAEVRLADGKTVRAHCVNPGRMEGVVEAGRRVWLRYVPSKTRKLAYTWELVEDHDEDGKMVLTGADTSAPNRIIGAALSTRAIPGFRRYRALRAEVRDGDSRVDFLLEGRTNHFVEVKNCHLVYPDRRAYFPDTVSDRASRHIRHLAEIVQRGERASVLFVVQRPDRIRSLRPSMLHDPAFADACRDAAAEGVRFHALQVRPTLEAYEIMRSLPVDLREYDAEKQQPWREDGLTRAGWRRSKKRK